MSRSGSAKTGSIGDIPKTMQIKYKDLDKDKETPVVVPETEAGGSADPGNWESKRSPTLKSGAETIEAAKGQARCQKRDKSASFMMEEEEVPSKRTKSESPSKSKKHTSRYYKNSRIKKIKKIISTVDDGGEPKPGTSSAPPEPVPDKKTLKRKAEKAKPKSEEESESEDDDVFYNMNTWIDINDNSQWDDFKNDQREISKKREERQAEMELLEEPAAKIRKHSTSEDELTEELENMHIGLNNVIDAVPAVVPAGQRPLKPKKDRQRTFLEAPVNTVYTDSNSNVFDLEEVVKWTKKQWNENLGNIAPMNYYASILVDNLPVIMIMMYRNKLKEIFETFGHIKHIGPAEVHDNADGEHNFSSTIYFATEAAAIRALELDNTYVYCSLIRVRRSLPPTEALSLGRRQVHLPLSPAVRDVHEGVRDERQRRGCVMAFAFLEFDGPKAVQRALELSRAAKIESKRAKIRNLS